MRLLAGFLLHVMEWSPIGPIALNFAQQCSHVGGEGAQSYAMIFRGEKVCFVAYGAIILKMLFLIAFVVHMKPS